MHGEHQPRPTANRQTSNGGGETAVDAVHIRFREKGPQTRYHCFDCNEQFQASSILDVFEHYGRIVHMQYYSDCLYCNGKVHQYRDGDNKQQYFHNCSRWKRQLEK